MSLIKDVSALRKLSQRLNNKPEQINNSRMPAGSPMLFYCELCGHESDRLPESYTTRPRKYCTPCQELKDANPDITNGTLLEEAKKLE